ncbi:MAG TPA: winged helix-turn-helix domain-containing protein [Caulobacteraceae bacterium]|jgi:TolB-like protein/DNA-binding winged helix-turn-helix (wHTH) protein
MAEGSRPPRRGRIELAHEPDLRLGPLLVQPSRRSVLTQDGRQWILEPRVMQGLIALGEFSGDMCSRDDLLSLCWADVVVGEDALNRVIGRLRRLGEETGAFSIQTIPRVGYRLMAEGSEHPSAPAPPPLPVPVAGPAAGPPVLAVLAFDDLCEGEDMAWFTDGVSEEIQQRVSRADGLKIIGRASSFQFRGPHKNAAHVGATLGATHILDGSVRRSGQRVRISAQLVECHEQTIVWSDRFERELTDIFAVQDGIAIAVAAALQVALAPLKPSHVDMAVYDRYLQARALLVEGSIDLAGRARAFDLLEEVVAGAPNFARAWSALAIERAWWLRFGDNRADRSLTRASAVHAAEIALSLDPAMGLAHQALSYLEPFGRHAAREALQERALEAAPQDPEVLSFHSRFCQIVGRMAEAGRHARLAYELNPLDVRVAAQYVSALCGSGESDACGELWEHLLVRWPRSGLVAFYAGFWTASRRDWARFDVVCAHLGDGRPPFWAEAVEPLARLRREDPDYWADQVARAQETLVRSGAVHLQTIVSIHAAGLTESAFELAEAAAFDQIWDADGPSPVDGVNSGVIFRPDNRPMIDDPRFVRLCGKLGLCDYWIATNRWPDCADTTPYDFRAAARAAS